MPVIVAQWRSVVALSMRSPAWLLAPLAPSLLLASPSLAAEASWDVSWDVQRSRQACIDRSPVTSYPALQRQVSTLTRNPVYARAAHLCKEEIGEIGDLLPKCDATATELMASLADVPQACLPDGC
jgi:hypothetical protein